MSANTSPGGPAFRRLPPWLRLGGLVVAIVSAFVIIAVSGSLSADKVRGWIDGYGVLGPVVFIVVAGALNCACFPGPLLAGAAGLLFGTALGTPVAMVSTTLSAVVACVISRWVAGDVVERLAGDRLKKLAALVERRGFLSVFYVRLLPGIPFTLFNYAVGLTRIGLGTMALATLIGCAPRTFAYVALGGSLGDFTSPETIIAIAILVVMAIGGGVVAYLQSKGRLTLPGSAAATSSPVDRSEAPR
jgi:uncharacterized membrane protein YdjX (TVP38/TMEM64 family)